MLATLALSANAQGEYKVTGILNGANGKTVYMQSSNMQSIDSCTVSNNRFSFQGKLSQPYCHAQLILNKADFHSPVAEPLDIIIEPGQTTIKGTASTLTDAEVTGGKTQAEKNELSKATKDVMAQIVKLNEQFVKAQTAAQRDSARAMIEPLAAVYKKCQTEFRKAHPDSYLSAEILTMEMSNMSFEELTAAYEALSPKVKATESGARVRGELEALGKVRPGKEAPLFSKTDVNGKMFNMKDLRGKVVIIDFWASWCVPCRKSNPHMLELYRKYHDRGLEMVYVADDDGSPAAWKKAIEKDGLTGEGFHHVLRGFKQGVDNNPDDVSNKYAIHFLPTKYLIDKEGKVVCKIDSSQEQVLDQKIEALLK